MLLQAEGGKGRGSDKASTNKDSVVGAIALPEIHVDLFWVLGTMIVGIWLAFDLHLQSQQ